MKVICRKNGSPAANFSDGKVYDAYKEPRKEHTLVWVIQDDRGHPKVILPGCPSPHLLIAGKAVGVFEPYETLEGERPMNYIVISDRWAQEEIIVTLEDLRAQGALWRRDPRGRLTRPIRLYEEIHDGCNVIIDDADEIVAVSTEDYDRWRAR